MSRFILPASGEWVGPPVLFHERRGIRVVLDGSKRLREHQLRGLKTHVPERTVRSHLEAVQALVHNGEHLRAAELARRETSHLVKSTALELERLMGIPRAKLKPFQKALLSPAERHKLPRRAMSVVKRARLLYEEVLEGKKVDVSDLEEVLGEFLQ